MNCRSAPLRCIIAVLQSSVNQGFLAFFDFVAVFGTVTSSILIRIDAKDSIGSSALRTVSSRSGAVQRVWPGRVAQSVGHLTRRSGVLGSIPGLATYFRFSFRFFQEGQLSVTGVSVARSTG